MTRNELAREQISNAANQLSSIHAAIVNLSRLMMLAPVVSMLFAITAQHFGAGTIVVIIGIFVILETTRRYCSHRQNVLRAGISTIANGCEFRIAKCMSIQIGSRFHCRITTECGELIVIDEPSLREIKWLFTGLAGFRFCYPFPVNAIVLPQQITQKVRANICNSKYWCISTAVATLREDVDLAEILRLNPQGVSAEQIKQEVHESTRRAIQRHAKKYADWQLGKMEDELAGQSIELSLWPYTVHFHTVDVKYANNSRAAA